MENNGTLVSSHDYGISEERRNLFYSLLKRKPEKRIPVSLVSSLIPSSLLRFLSEKTGSSEGVYRGIDFTLHENPEPGNLRVDLYVKGQRKIPDGFIYNIMSECFQERKRILSGKVNVLTGFDFKMAS